MKANKRYLCFALIALAVAVILLTCFSSKSPLVALRIHEGMSRDQVYGITGGMGEYLTSSMSLERFRLFPAGELTLRYDAEHVMDFEMKGTSIAVGVIAVAAALAVIALCVYQIVMSQKNSKHA